MTERPGAEARPDTDGFDPIESGRRLFAQPCAFAWAASSLETLPVESGPEIGFAGRSNVGKSSLVNALTGQSHLARTSRTPGRTRELIFFGLGEALTIVDMPGYGYAAAPREQIRAWTELSRAFLRGRRSLARLYLLVDARHGLKAADQSTLEDLDRAAVSFQLVLTKADELAAGEGARTIAATEAQLARHPAAFPAVLLTSARTGLGIPELRGAVATLLAERA